jgi:hypothetical protein
MRARASGLQDGSGGTNTSNTAGYKDLAFRGSP